MKSLKELLGEADGRARPSPGGFFPSFGLTRNPFPPNRTIIPEVIYSQERAVELFVRNVQAVLDSKPQRRAMAVLGTTGGGKTHFLRHCQHLFREYCRDHQRRFAFLEFQAGSGSVQALIRDALDAANRTTIQFGEFDLITAIVRKIDQDISKINEIRQTDLRSAIQNLIRASDKAFEPQDRGRQFDFDRLRDVCRKWLDGASITQTEQKYLGVYSRINTASMAARIHRELLALARKLELVEGMFLCLDELETLFRGGLRTAKIQSFLQDLRYMYDESVKGNEGYSLLVISASTDEGSVNLRDFNYPVYQRLGFEADSRVALQPIQGVVDAINFANVYIDFEHQRWKAENEGSRVPKHPRLLLTEAEIEEAYRTALDAMRTTLRGAGALAQARVLEALHNKVERKREASA